MSSEFRTIEDRTLININALELKSVEYNKKKKEVCILYGLSMKMSVQTSGVLRVEITIIIVDRQYASYFLS